MSIYTKVRRNVTIALFITKGILKRHLWRSKKFEYRVWSSVFHIHSVAKRARARKDDHKCLSSGPHIAECEIEESLKLILSVAEDLSNFSRGKLEVGTAPGFSAWYKTGFETEDFNKGPGNCWNHRPTQAQHTSSYGAGFWA